MGENDSCSESAVKCFSLITSAAVVNAFKSRCSASEPDTIGCLFTNRQGLCLGAKGKIDPHMSGIAMAISEQACKLEPNLNPPTVILHSGQRRCVIQKEGEITGVIYKETA